MKYKLMVNKDNITLTKTKATNTESNTQSKNHLLKSINITKQSGIEAQTIDSLD